MEKVKRDGRVAILYSVGYGAGWSTWADDHMAETMCMDARIVSAFLHAGEAAAVAAALSIYPDVYTGGSTGLTVDWVDESKVFEITEYDGFENVRIISDEKFMVA